MAWIDMGLVRQQFPQTPDRGNELFSVLLRPRHAPHVVSIHRVAREGIPPDAEDYAARGVTWHLHDLDPIAGDFADPIVEVREYLGNHDARLELE